MTIINKSLIKEYPSGGSASNTILVNADGEPIITAKQIQFVSTADATFSAIKSGNIAIVKVTVSAPSPGPQNANTVYAGPTSGSAANPTWRSLVAADVPFAALAAGSSVKHALASYDNTDGRLLEALSGIVIEPNTNTLLGNAGSDFIVQAGTSKNIQLITDTDSFVNVLSGGLQVTTVGGTGAKITTTLTAVTLTSSGENISINLNPTGTGIVNLDSTVNFKTGATGPTGSLSTDTTGVYFGTGSRTTLIRLPTAGAVSINASLNVITTLGNVAANINTTTTDVNFTSSSTNANVNLASTGTGNINLNGITKINAPILDMTTSNPGAGVLSTVSNTSNTASSDASINISTAGSSAGNPYLKFTVVGKEDFVIGLNNAQGGNILNFVPSGNIAGTAALALQATNANFGGSISTNGFISLNGNNLRAYSNQVVSKTTNYSITSSDTGTSFNNSGASGAVIWTLPNAPTIGYVYYFTQTTTFEERIATPNSSYTIQIPGSISSAGGYINSIVVGSTLKLEYGATGKWYGTVSGTWNVT